MQHLILKCGKGQFHIFQKEKQSHSSGWISCLVTDNAHAASHSSAGGLAAAYVAFNHFVPPGGAL